jgi:hypothetical protein
MPFQTTHEILFVLRVGWIVSVPQPHYPPKKQACPEPVHVILFGKSVFGDVTKVRNLKW